MLVHNAALIVKVGPARAPDFQDAAFEDFEAVFVSEALDGCLSVAVHLKSHTSSLTGTTKPDTDIGANGPG
jgi:hypothetical protein